MSEAQTYTKKDFESGSEVRWCPGCGDYAILAQVQAVLPTLPHRRENYLFISGIGCSSRFPYYMNTYGFHTIHGRAPAIVSGARVSNPNLSVWMVTGDGDGLSIGGNHMLHILRRNVDVNILLFDNRIYGLTKGQYSPTSTEGTVTKSSPYGSLDHPVDPVAFALGAGASFIARTSDRDLPHLRETLKAADAHRGTSFVHIMQNCIVFNDAVWENYTEKEIRSDHIVYAKSGEPLVFGKQSDKVMVLDQDMRPVAAALGQEPAGTTVLRHDTRNKSKAWMLAQMDGVRAPMPMGVLYEENRTVYEEDLLKQEADILAEKGPGDLKSLFYTSDTWEIK